MSANFEQHLTVQQVERLPNTDVRRVALDLARLIEGIGSDPNYPELTPTPTIVGSYPISPTNARDLDFEVSGVTWEHLQNKFLEMQDRFQSVFVTKGIENGTIPQDRRDEGYGGNAFVAVWLVLKDGRKVNLSTPTIVDGNSSRYDLSTVSHVPDLSFEAACQRRLFAHNAMGFDPIQAKMIDPHGGMEALISRQLKIINPDAFRSDPLNIYLAIQEMANRQMSPEINTNLLLKEVASSDAGLQDANKSFEPRVNYARCRLLVASKPPSFTLGMARDLGLISYHFSSLDVALGTQEDWEHAMRKADQAWERVYQDSSLTENDKIYTVLAAIGHDVRAFNPALLNDVISYFNFRVGSDEQADFKNRIISCIMMLNVDLDISLFPDGAAGDF